MAFKDWGHFLTGGLGTKKGRNFLFGEDASNEKLSNFTPEQEQLFSQFIQQLIGGGAGGQGSLQNVLKQLQAMSDPNSQEYQDFEAPYLQEFQQETLPGIAERFAGAGALSSSGFGQALGGAASKYKSNLQGQKFGMMQNALQQLLNQSQFALNTQPFSYQQNPASPGFISQAGGGIIKGLFGG